MNDTASLAALPRQAGGKGPARAERRAGRVPAIIYGGDRPPSAVSIDGRRLLRLMGQGGFASSLLDVRIEGGGSERVIPKEIQRHPVTGAPLHADFLRVSAESELQVPVAVVFINEDECPGIREGGVLSVVRHEVELVCLADSLPESISADLSGLGPGDSIRITDLAMPEGCRPAVDDRDFMIASIIPPGGPQTEEAEAEDAGDGDGAGEADG